MTAQLKNTGRRKNNSRFIENGLSESKANIKENRDGRWTEKLFLTSLEPQQLLGHLNLLSDLRQ